MRTGPFSVTRPEPNRHIPDPTRLADNRQNTDPTGTDQLAMTPKVEFSVYSINIIYVVKFKLKNVTNVQHN